MTIQEIQSGFVDEWVLVGEPDTNEALQVLSGRVLHHSRDRDEVYRQAVALRPKRYAVLFMGHMAPNTAVVL